MKTKQSSLPPMTETEFQEQVIELALLYGWRVAHFRPGRTVKGWRTPVSADGRGFVDLVLARKGRLIFAELKSDTGQVSAEQQAWLEDLRSTNRCDVYVWRPAQWDEVVKVLAWPTRMY